MAVVPPMASASAKTATSVKPGAFRSVRPAVLHVLPETLERGEDPHVSPPSRNARRLAQVEPELVVEVAFPRLSH